MNLYKRDNHVTESKPIRWICYCFSHLIGLLSVKWLSLLYKFTRVFFIYFLFLSDEGPTLETLDHTIRTGSTPTFFLYISYMRTIIYSIKSTKDEYVFFCFWETTMYVTIITITFLAVRYIFIGDSVITSAIWKKNIRVFKELKFHEKSC